MEAKFVTLEEELKKNPEVKEEDLQTLREWLEKQPHLPTLTDAELVLFLHSCYFKLEPTKEAIDTYFTVRTHAPELFTERTLNSPGIPTVMQTVNLVILPEGKNGQFVSLYQLHDTNPRNYSFTHATKTWCVLIESLLARHGTNSGLVCVLDLKGVSMGHLALNLTVLAKFFVYFQEALPVRIKGLLIVNASSIIDHLLMLIKPFMKKELIDMMSVHKSADVVRELLDVEHLPSDYGGRQKSMKEMSMGFSTDILRAYETYALQQEKRLVNESLRVGKAKTESDLFGVQGSFKKLELD